MPTRTDIQKVGEVSGPPNLIPEIMMIHAQTILAVAAIWAAGSLATRAGAPAEPVDPLDRCNVVWTTPSADHNGSMPIGNGDVGANVWVEPGGDLLLLLSKTDAWSENCRLLKLGRLRLALSPKLLADDPAFRQTLRLRQGEILVESGQDARRVTLRIWVDANRPVIRIEADSPSPFDLRASLEVWRTEPRVLRGKEINSAYGLQGAPFPVVVSPDTVLGERNGRIVWYHRNETSIWKNNLTHQGLAGFVAQSTDPLLQRTFGGRIEAPGLVSENPTTLRSALPRTRFELSIYPLCVRTSTGAEWVNRLDAVVSEAGSRNLEVDRNRHRAWWNDFWNRSWIRVSGPPETATLTHAYTLQRWINACAGRGAYPIKFNGSIFTVDGAGFDADYRQWGGPYWWQNTRLPYWPMLACGDFDMMLPLFRMYRESLPLAEYRTDVWYGHSGAFIGETVYFWGMYNNTNYGWERDPNLPVGELVNPYIRREYTASLELLALMLDYHAHTDDETFLRRTLLPMCDSFLDFWDRHYANDDAGRMKMYPAQALETLQDALNPTPDLAGLHHVLGRLLTLPEKQVGSERRNSWKSLLRKVPTLPLGETTGGKFILGAAKVFGGRGNSENPELYAVFPFRLFGVGKPDLDVGRRTFARRPVKGNSGWRQDDTQAALLGLAREAAAYVLGRAKNKHEGSRFPAFWGPNFDWIPDQDHGGNLMMALQCMLMQADDGKILLMPGWPEDWNVDFRLRAPHNTIVEGTLEAGRVVRLEVTPAQRRQDVVILEAR